MEQEGSLDFKALRAKFQEEAALRQLKSKPAIPEKPKLIPPPGARVSLLSSINAAVENKNPVIPRVVFKDAKTGSEAKRPLPSIPTKLPVRDSNFNTEILDHHQKKEGGVVKQSFKDRKLPLVLPVPSVGDQSDPAPPANSLPPRKKTFHPFKFSKAGRESTEISTCINTSEGPVNASEGPASGSWGPINSNESPFDTGKSLVNTSEGDVNISESLANDSECPASTSEGPAETSENPHNITLGPTSVSEDLPGISESSISTTDGLLIIDGVVIPPPLGADEIDGEFPTLENGDIPSEVGLSSEPQSPCSGMLEAPPSEHERADESSTGSRTPPCDQRVLNALEKAKRKFSPFPSMQQARTKSASPVNGDQSGETTPCPELPPIDYDDLIGRVPSAASVPQEDKLDGSSPTLDSPALPDVLFGSPEHEPVEVSQLEAPEVPNFETLGFEAPHLLTNEIGAFEYGEPRALDIGALNVGALDLGAPESGDGKLGDPDFGFQENEAPEAEAPGTDSPGSPSYKESEPQPGVLQEEGHYESCDNVYEDVEAVNKFRRGQNPRKRQKGPPKNPYADTQPVSEESHKSSWFFNSRNERKASPEAHDDKEQKKKEKQRLEKEKKEQKEREKKENEMKKKFKITGEEEAMYQAKVILPSKGRKNDLPVKNGDIVSIIRTTNCPKGKWLARDGNNKYGYISVKSVELDIKEMLELGKKAQAAGRATAVEGETVSTGSRSSNHPLSACSFTDDSEEWTCDDDDTLSPTENIGNVQPIPGVDMFSNHTDVQHAVDDGNPEGSNMQTRNEALHKLATFFQQPRETTTTEIEDSTIAGRTEEAPSLPYPAEESSYNSGEEEVMEILPPPELYADSVDDDPASQPAIGME